MKSVASSSLWVAGAQVISVASLLLGTRLITEWLGPADYGVVSLVVGAGALFLNVLFNPVKQSLERYYATAEKDGCLEGLLSILKCLNRKLIVFFGFAGIISCSLVYFIFPDHWISFFIGIFLVLSYQRRDFEISFYIASLKYKLASILTASDAVLRPVFALAALYFFAKSPESVLMGYAASAFAMVFIAKIAFSPEEKMLGPASFNKEKLTLEVKAYARPMAAFALFSWITTTADRFLVGGILGVETVGVYSVAYAVLYQIYWNGHVVLLKIFRPRYFHAYEHGGGAAAASIYIKWISLALFCMFFANLFFLFFSKIAVAFLFAKNYSRAADVMPYMSLAFTFAVLTGLAQQLAFARKNSLVVTKVRALGAFFALALTPPGLLYFGFDGIGYSMVAYFFVEFSVMFFVVRPYFSDLRKGVKNEREG